MARVTEHNDSSQLQRVCRDGGFRRVLRRSLIRRDTSEDSQLWLLDSFKLRRSLIRRDTSESSRLWLLDGFKLRSLIRRDISENSQLWLLAPFKKKSDQKTLSCSFFMPKCPCIPLVALGSQQRDPDFSHLL